MTDADRLEAQARLAEGLEGKGAKRKVRTPEGARRFHLPIGSPIVPVSVPAPRAFAGTSWELERERLADQLVADRSKLHDPEWRRRTDALVMYGDTPAQRRENVVRRALGMAEYARLHPEPPAKVEAAKPTPAAERVMRERPELGKRMDQLAAVRAQVLAVDPKDRRAGGDLSGWRTSPDLAFGPAFTMDDLSEGLAGQARMYEHDYAPLLPPDWLTDDPARLKANQERHLQDAINNRVDDPDFGERVDRYARQLLAGGAVSPGSLGDYLAALALTRGVAEGVDAHEGTLWRGERPGRAPEPGDVLERPLASFSTDRTVAERFGRPPGDEPGGDPGVVYEMNGARGVDVAGRGSGGPMPQEHEFLTGGRFRVTSVEQAEGQDSRHHLAHLEPSHPDALTAAELGPQPEFWVPPTEEHKLPDGGMDAEWEAAYQRSNDARKAWKAKAIKALALGSVTVDELEKLGEYPGTGSGGRDNIGPLPPELYHVTTAADAVARDGLKTRDELGQVSGHGLGGGASDTVSFTTDPRIAENIRRGILEAHDVATGALTPEEMLEHARTGDDASRPYLTDVVRNWDRTWEPGDPFPQGLQAILDGDVIQYQMGATVPEVEAERGPGWTGIASPPHVPYGVDKDHFNYFRRPATPAEQADNAMELYKALAMFREHAGGPMDPLFFSQDTAALAAMDPGQVRILKLRPRPGAQGYQVSALGEWRTWTGAAVEPAPDTYGAEKLAEAKAAVRHVRTAEGARRYRLPVGAPIVPVPELDAGVPPWRREFPDAGAGVVFPDAAASRMSYWDLQRQNVGGVPGKVRGARVDTAGRLPDRLYAVTLRGQQAGHGLLQPESLGDFLGPNREAPAVRLTADPQRAALAAHDVQALQAALEYAGPDPGQAALEDETPDHKAWRERLVGSLSAAAENQGWRFRQLPETLYAPAGTVFESWLRQRQDATGLDPAAVRQVLDTRDRVGVEALRGANPRVLALPGRAADGLVTGGALVTNDGDTYGDLLRVYGPVPLVASADMGTPPVAAVTPEATWRDVTELLEWGDEPLGVPGAVYGPGGDYGGDKAMQAKAMVARDVAARLPDDDGTTTALMDAGFRLGSLTRSTGPEQWRASLGHEARWETYVDADGHPYRPWSYLGTGPDAQEGLPEATDRRVVRGDDPELRRQLREWGASTMVHMWATTSNNQHKESLAIQRAAADEFGVDDRYVAGWDVQRPGEVDAEYERHGELYRRFLRAQYEGTQDRLKAAGIRNLRLWRGMRRGGPGDESPGRTPLWWNTSSGEASDIPLRPLSAFSADESVARQEFGGGGWGQSVEGRVVEAVIPRERVLSFPRTGFGALDESEFVVLAGPGSYEVYDASDPDPHPDAEA